MRYFWEGGLLLSDVFLENLKDCQLPFDGERKKLFSVQQIQYKWLSVFNANVLVQSKLLELQGLAS